MGVQVCNVVLKFGFEDRVLGFPLWNPQFLQSMTLSGSDGEDLLPIALRMIGVKFVVHGAELQPKHLHL